MTIGAVSAAAAKLSQRLRHEQTVAIGAAAIAIGVNGAAAVMAKPSRSRKRVSIAATEIGAAAIATGAVVVAMVRAKLFRNRHRSNRRRSSQSNAALIAIGATAIAVGAGITARVATG